MIDTDVERGPFWPAHDKIIHLINDRGLCYDYKFIFPITVSEFYEIFPLEIVNRIRGLVEMEPMEERKPSKPDSDFVRQVKIKLGFAKQEDYF